MIPVLFRWLSGGSPLWTWTAVIVGAALWWVLLWAAAKILGLEHKRPARVVALTRNSLFLIGMIFLFDLFLVPIVLVSFHGVALVCLLTCSVAAITFLVRVDDRESPGSGKGANLVKREGTPVADLFATPKRRRML